MFPGVVACLMVNQGGTAGVPLVPLQDEGVFNEKMYAKERMPWRRNCFITKTVIPLNAAQK